MGLRIGAAMRFPTSTTIVAARHEGLREFWTEYRKTFGEMKSEFRNVFATEDGAALEWTTEGTSNGDRVSYEGESILEFEGGKVRRFMAYFDTRDLAPQVVD